MRKNVTLLLFALCFTAAAQNNSTTASQSKIYITHVTVIDTETGKEEADQTVLISDGKITDVAKSRSRVAPRSSRIVDGRCRYLIPGLWDMHVHGKRLGSFRSTETMAIHIDFQRLAIFVHRRDGEAISDDHKVDMTEAGRERDAPIDVINPQALAEM